MGREEAKGVSAMEDRNSEVCVLLMSCARVLD